MTPTTRQTRWSARVDRDDWDSLRDAAKRQGTSLSDLLTNAAVALDPVDVRPSAEIHERAVRLDLPTETRVRLRHLAYSARVRIADVVSTIAARAEMGAHAML